MEIAIHANSTNETVPRVGMEFNSEQDVYDFYNKYAKEVGFSIRRSKGHKDQYGHWVNRVFCCSCQGTRIKDKRDDDVKYYRPETRFGCLAVLKVARFNGKFQITEFIADHTHALASPSKHMFLRSQRTINLAQAVELEIADRSGLAPKKSVGILARKVGGVENLGFIPEDYNNYLRTKRTKEMKVGDTSGVLEYLQNMQHDDPKFSYAIQDFERLLADRRYEELKADYKDNQSKPSLPYPIEILKHVADIYTSTIFKIFSKELWLTWDCEMHIIQSTGTITSYKVIPSGKLHHHTVIFDSSNSTVSCSCKKFEFASILCAHALKVLSFQNFKRVPNQYILKRWTKEAKIGVTLNSSLSTRSNDPKVDVGTRYKSLLRWYSHLAARAAMSEQSFEIAMGDGEKTLSKVEATLKQLSIEESLNKCGEEKIFQVDAREQNENNGKKVQGIKCKPKRKGDGSSIRPKNALEKATRKGKTSK
ncbi:hypothetical protein V6N11_067287 [Hibiscus sabdariffa]|uniref:Protein FAR1-RELATED SEQUENCE n=1 Tax=Hibiscus sabdariffa TaxID=183260 RepID=A0ABR2SQM5_9ROSI